MATIQDVARRAEVSIATVSRVINNHPTVNPAIRRVVLQAIDELHYRPNPIARTLRTARTRSLGLVLSTFRGAESMGAGIWAAQSVAQQHGYAVLLADSRFDPDEEARNILNLLDRRIDGLLCNPVQSSRLIADLVADRGVPTVLFAWTVANPVLPTMVMNEAAAVDKAVGHLVELGHRRIGVVMSAGPAGTGSPIRQRLVHQAPRARGIDPEGDWDCVVTSLRGCTAAVQNLVSNPARPTALLIAASNLAPGVFAGIRSVGAEVPGDVSLICFGDSLWAEVISAPMSVISFDFSQQLRSATDLLLDLIDGKPDLPHALEQHAQYVRRGSVDTAPTRRSHVSPARRGRCTGSAI